MAVSAPIHGTRGLAAPASAHGLLPATMCSPWVNRAWPLLLVVGELYSSWETFPAPAVLLSYVTKTVQSALDEPESLKDYLLGLPGRRML